MLIAALKRQGRLRECAAVRLLFATRPFFRRGPWLCMLIVTAKCALDQRTAVRGVRGNGLISDL